MSHRSSDLKLRSLLGRSRLGGSSHLVLLLPSGYVKIAIENGYL